LAPRYRRASRVPGRKVSILKKFGNLDCPRWAPGAVPRSRSRSKHWSNSHKIEPEAAISRKHFRAPERSDFDRWRRRRGTSPSTANQPNFNLVQINLYLIEPTGRPDLVLRTSKPAAFPPCRGVAWLLQRTASRCLSPFPTEAGGSRPLLLRRGRKELPGRFRDFRRSVAAHSPACVNRNARGNPPRWVVLRQCSTRSFATDQYPKPPYYSPDPFSMSDAYLRTIERGGSTFLVSRPVGQAQAIHQLL
jgi:hypothetical protein